MVEILSRLQVFEENHILYWLPSSSCCPGSPRVYFLIKQYHQFKFVLTRINPADADTEDVPICGSTQLPTESAAIATSTPGACINTISVFNASTKADVDRFTQTYVLLRLFEILSCLPK